MIVLTSVSKKIFHVMPGDMFHLSVTEDGFRDTVITETITEQRTIDFAASFRFAREDGTCLGFHLSGFFGNAAELPEEIQNAKRLEDLTDEQRSNFAKSVGIRIDS